MSDQPKSIMVLTIETDPQEVLRVTLPSGQVLLFEQQENLMPLLNREIAAMHQPKPTMGELIETAAYDCSETTQQERKRVIGEAINAALAKVKKGPMSDEPTTGEQRTQCPCCGQIIPTQKELAQPKPMTGNSGQDSQEWTEERVRRFMDCPMPHKSLADAINAASSAAIRDAVKKEQQYWWKQVDKIINEHSRELSIALAAERELHDKITLSWTLSKSDNQQLRKELAEEREKVRQGLECITTRTRERDSCKEQLAADRSGNSLQR